MVVEFVLIVGFMVVVAAGILWMFYLQKRRREAMHAFCAKHGYTFLEHDWHADERYDGFEPFDVGGSRRGRNLVRGSHGDRPFEVFQYQYTVQHGKHSSTHYFRVACIETPIPAPGLVVRPEHLGHKIFDALGGEDIDFASDAFSRRFWVRCQDRRFAYDVLHPAMQEWLMDRTRVWQWHGDRLLIHERGHLLPAHVHAMLDELAAFVDRLPRHLLAEHR